MPDTPTSSELSATPPDAAAAMAAPAGTQTLMRGLAIVQAVADGARDLRAICARIGVARSTTHRLASSLVQERYLRVVAGLGYALGPKLIELGFQAREGFPLAALARPHLHGLAELTGDTIHLAVRDGDEVLYLEKIPGKKGLEMRSRVGHRMPLAATGVGKALLLDLDETQWLRLHEVGAPVSPRASGAGQGWEAFRERMRDYAAHGYAYDLEDNEPSIRCVSAPVRDAGGVIVAALSVSSTVPYLSLERMAELVPTVKQVAAAVSAELGWRAPARA